MNGMDHDAFMLSQHAEHGLGLVLERPASMHRDSRWFIHGQQPGVPINNVSFLEW